ncbi:MAG TPA: NPCBM/NEW2 domain-containing protein [Phycisphaerae bacterium]|nr:NPCBM/NEW2 domain-containing protein [Phycisphaerae bacterium]
MTHVRSGTTITAAFRLPETTRLNRACLCALPLLLLACNRHAPPTPVAASAPAPQIDELGPVAPSLAQVFTDGHWGFGAQGAFGNASLTPITVKGATYLNGIGTVPPTNGSAHVVYHLNRRYARFTAQVALNDTSNNAATPVTFRIVADGTELWRSPPISSHADPAPFDVGITNVDRLELFVDCPGSNNQVPSVWLNPCLKP